MIRGWLRILLVVAAGWAPIVAVVVLLVLAAPAPAQLRPAPGAPAWHCVLGWDWRPGTPTRYLCFAPRPRLRVP